MIRRHPSIAPMHPGELLREDILPALSMDEQAVANALRIPQRMLRGIINEKQPVTPEIAVQFGRLFGNGSHFWLNLQRSYDEAAAAQTATGVTASS